MQRHFYNSQSAITRAAETAVAFLCSVVIYSYAERKENTLRKTRTLRQFRNFALFAVVGDFYEYMSFVIAVKIIAVYNANRIVELHSKLKAEPASREDLQYPTVCDFRPYAGRYFYTFACV